MTEPRPLVSELARVAADDPQGRAIRFAEDGISLSFAALWDHGSRAAAALTELEVKPGNRVAVAMATTIDVVVVVVGILQLGATLVPLRARGRLRIDTHDADAVSAAVRASGAQLCVVPDASRSSYANCIARETSGVSVVTAEEIAGARLPPLPFDADRVRPDAGLVMQFSSGSTGMPKGVLLTQANVAANLHAVIDRLRVQPDDRLVSWLPLFHDLGLIGKLFLALRLGCDTVLMRPQSFVREPLQWLNWLSRHRATITAGPQVAYDLCVSRAEAAPEALAGADLSTVRCMVNGAEMISAASCRRFVELFRAFGLRENVITPAYGLAENSVLVTIRSPGKPYPVRHLDRRALHAGEVRLVKDGPDAVELVGHGTPGPGIDVRVRSEASTDLPPRAIGEIVIGGTSAATHVAGADGTLMPLSADGFIASGDLGSMIDGDLYCIGRTKEIFRHGGRTFAPADIEATVLTCKKMAPLGVAAVAVPYAGSPDRLLIVAECDNGPVDALTVAATEIRLALLRRMQLVPSEVILIARGRLPRTSSGKLRRMALRTAYMAGEIERVVPVLHRGLGRNRDDAADVAGRGRSEGEWRT